MAHRVRGAPPKKRDSSLIALNDRAGSSECQAAVQGSDAIRRQRSVAIWDAQSAKADRRVAILRQFDQPDCRRSYSAAQLLVKHGEPADADGGVGDAEFAGV